MTVQLEAERQVLEQRLAASERFIRTITDNVPVRLAYFDPEGRFQFVNQVLCDRFGRTREQMLGHLLREIVGAAPDSPMSQRFRLAIAGAPQRFEYEDQVNGETRHIHTQLIPDVGADGSIRGVFGVGVDVTHLKAVERSLRDLTEVFDNTTDFIAQADWQGHVLYINPAGRRLMDYSPTTPVTGHMTSEYFSESTNARWAGEAGTSICAAGSSTVRSSHGASIPVNS